MYNVRLTIFVLLWVVSTAIVSFISWNVNISLTFFIITASALGGWLSYLFIQLTRIYAGESHNLDALQKMILNEASYAIIASDSKGVITFFNPAAEKMLGYCAEELIGKETPSVFHDPDEVAARAIEFSQALNEPLAPGFDVFIVKSRKGLLNMHEWTYVRKDGARLPVMLAISALRNPRKKIIGFLGIASDISVQRQSQYDLSVARDQLTIAAEVAKLGIWTLNVADNSLIWNDRMFEIYQQPMELRNRGLNYEHWRTRLHPDDAQSTELLLKEAIEGRRDYNPIFRIILPDGTTHFIQGGAQIERDKQGKVVRVTGINLDITGQYKYETLLREMVYVDGLTKIPNRRRFEEQLDVELRHARRAQKPLALLMIDVDFFKLYNDFYGHQAGDACLQKIAATLTLNISRPKDLIARYGGEEFVCLLPETNEVGARKIAARLNKAIQTLAIEHPRSKIASVVTISIGLSGVCPLADTSPAMLIAAADKCLYQAKNEGRNRICSDWSD